MWDSPLYNSYLILYTTLCVYYFCVVALDKCGPLHTQWGSTKLHLSLWHLPHPIKLLALSSSSSSSLSSYRNHYHLHHNHHLCHHRHHPKLGSHPIKEGAKSISFYFWRFSIPGFSFRNLQYEINLWGHLNFCLQEQNCSSENKDAITGTRNSGRAILNGYEASGCRLACGVYQQGTAARQEQICSKHNRYKALCRKTKEEKCSYCRDPLVVSCKPDDPVPTAGTCRDDRPPDVPSDPVRTSDPYRYDSSERRWPVFAQ